MSEQPEHERKLVWAYCPVCNGAMGQVEITCPHCGYTVPPDPTPPDPDAVTSQFEIRLLLYLMVLTAVVSFICQALGHGGWVLAPPLFISGILVWRTRKVSFAAWPGIVIGFTVGFCLTLSRELAARIWGGLFIATVFGCPLNVWLKGFPKSGCLAIVVGIASIYAAGWFFIR